MSKSVKKIQNINQAVEIIDRQLKKAKNNSLFNLKAKLYRFDLEMNEALDYLIFNHNDKAKEYLKILATSNYPIKYGAQAIMILHQNNGANELYNRYYNSRNKRERLAFFLFLSSYLEKKQVDGMEPKIKESLKDKDTIIQLESEYLLKNCKKNL